MLPLCNFLEGSGKYVQITNRAMELKGLVSGPCRLPRLPLTEEEDHTLKQLMKRTECHLILHGGIYDGISSVRS